MDFMHPSKEPLIVVSNRLPVSIKNQQNEWKIQTSSGGLASALTGVQSEIPFQWIGWPGASFFPHQQKEIESALAEKNLVPIFLNKEQEEHYYHNLCNSYLWPLFHYFTEQVTHSLESWRFYEEVNQLFAQKVAELAPIGSRVWVHDFHLMLLPKLLRELRADVKIGFFLHIPFPSSEIYRMLPKRKVLLEGILGSDYIGFHTTDYAKHFRLSCLRILGLSAEQGQIVHQSRKVGVGIHPIGMNVSSFEEVLSKPKYFSYIKEMKERYNSHKVILGVERLDYTKGISLKLQAFEVFLEKNPEWIGKIILLQVIVPCRHNSPEYQQHRSEIEKLVSRINGRFSRPGFNPIHYMYRSLPRAELIALYCLADICMVTSIRDGMNLVAQEFIYCAQRAQTKGCLILSEFAGAAHHLPHALMVNPFDIEGMALTIKEALSLPLEKKEDMLNQMQERVCLLNSPLWAKHFLTEMQKTTEENACSLKGHFLTEEEKVELSQKALKARKRVLLLDYDGTLREITSHPTEAKPTREILSLLKQLSLLEHTEVHLVSGRDSKTLESWFGELFVHLSAEHGFSHRAKAKKEWSAFKEVDLSWMPYVETLLKKVVDEVPGSFLENKESVLCWHYRLADSDYGQWRANELYINLVQELANFPVEITSGKCILEVKAQGLSKARYVQKVLQNTSSDDFILCMGDDSTDLEMYKALPENATCIHIGELSSSTLYHLKTPSEARSFLHQILDALNQETLKTSEE